MLIRRAVVVDLPAIVRLFATPDEGNLKHEDPREPLDPRYSAAFEAISRDPDNTLFVAEVDGCVAGAFQLTVIQYVANLGGRVAVIENVIVDPGFRKRGIGEAMMHFAAGEARRRACIRIQLTSRKTRTRAHRFYERLGYERSHDGFRLPLS